MAQAAEVNVAYSNDIDIVFLYLPAVNANCPLCTVSLKPPWWRRHRSLDPSSLRAAIFSFMVSLEQIANHKTVINWIN